MRITHIELCGFRGFRKPTRIEVSRGFLVISGRNGTGKSTLVDAIEFVVTGSLERYRAEKGGRESIGDYLWWRGPGSADAHFVKLGLADGKGESIELIRSRDEGLNVSATIVERLLCDPATMPRDAVEHLCKTSIIRDELIAALSLDMTDPARFEFVRSALGAVAAIDLKEKVERATAITEGVWREAEEEGQRATSRLHATLAELSDARTAASRAADLGAALVRLRGVLAFPTSEVGEILAAARSHVAKRRALLQSIAELPEDVRKLKVLEQGASGASFEGEFGRLRGLLRVVRSKHEVLVARLEEVESRLAAEERANTTAASLGALLSHGERVGLEQGHCPLCRAERTEAEYTEALGQLRIRLESIAGSLAEARASAEDLRREEAAARAEMEEVEAKHASMAQLRKSHEDQHATALERWRGLAGGESSLPSVEEVERRISEERDRLVEIEQNMLILEASQSIERVTQLEALASVIRQEVDSAGARAAAAQGAVEALRSADKHIIRVNAEIVDERLASISPMLSELYYRLRPHRNWRTIDYRIRGDVRRFLSLHVGDGLNPQFLFSTGERRAAGLAFLLAISLSRPWCRWQTLVLDDPVQHIDDFRALQVVEVLAALRRADRQVICAVEDSELADLLCRRLRGTEESQGARVDLDYHPTGGGRVLQQSPIYPLPESAVLSA